MVVRFPGRNARRELDRRVEVVSVEEEVAAECSLTATKGPSVVSVLPSWTRTVVAISAGCIQTPGVTPGVWLIAW